MLTVKIPNQNKIGTTLIGTEYLSTNVFTKNFNLFI